MENIIDSGLGNLKLRCYALTSRNQNILGSCLYEIIGNFRQLLSDDENFRPPVEKQLNCPKVSRVSSIRIQWNITDIGGIQ